MEVAVAGWAKNGILFNCSFGRPIAPRFCPFKLTFVAPASEVEIKIFCLAVKVLLSPALKFTVWAAWLVVVTKVTVTAPVKLKFNASGPAVEATLPAPVIFMRLAHGFAKTV